MNHQGHIKYCLILFCTTNEKGAFVRVAKQGEAWLAQGQPSMSTSSRVKVGDYVEALLSPVPALGSAQQASQKWRTGVVCEQQGSKGVLTGELVICYDSTTLGKVFQVPCLRAVCARMAPVCMYCGENDSANSFHSLLLSTSFGCFFIRTALNICSSEI